MDIVDVGELGGVDAVVVVVVVGVGVGVDVEPVTITFATIDGCTAQ
jgi:hypothetical protein